MASISNPFKKIAPALVDQLDAKSSELSTKAADEQASARTFAELAAEAHQASDLAAKQAVAVDTARNVLLEAGVTL
ncbi:hypothetical protein PBI_ELVA_68 [Microbacterium phage Elva]|uniref:hypothetical protein n=1 Tax=Microbacterium phage Elva TaxID=2126929 RepID=UPI000D1FECA9|nr:hypothetical protein QDW20_gp68 [Microbacterium phage Elva]AVR56809.1 hypothetical protein PBI_ELVA_68 [Microbacterium phage Elva]